jgi:glycosyltransferase involved in cell wall biosynthesis
MPKATEKEILDNTAVIIPAYNAAAHLTGVLASVQEVIPALRVIVVDDGSADETFRTASMAGVQVIQHPVNLGKGKALSTGYERTISMGMRYGVTLDADGQHNPSEIPKFARRVAETGADMVVGNRFGELGEMPWLRRATNWLTSKVVSALTGQKIPDSQNGYRMIGTHVMTAVEVEATRYEAESEILIKAGRKGFRIESVPVETIYGEEVSAIHPVVDTVRFFRLVYKALFW